MSAGVPAKIAVEIVPRELAGVLTKQAAVVGRPNRLTEVLPRMFAEGPTTN
jgi:hypothetical protein